MAKKKKKTNRLKSAESNISAEEKRARQKAAFQKNKKYILPLITNTILSYGIYLHLMKIEELVIPSLWVYFAVAAISSFSYVIYNRGFSRKNITEDMLPDSMSLQEKKEFIEDGKRRIEKSKWMLTIILPLIFTFLFDLMNMYIFEPLLHSMGII